MSVSFFRCRLFLLFVCNWTITSGADNIVSVSAPETLAQGSTVSIEVSYLASTNRDILIIFQRIALRGLSLEKRELLLVQVAHAPHSCSY